METLELPVLEEEEEETEHPATCAGEPIDLAAFALWQDASRPEMAEAATAEESA